MMKNKSLWKGLIVMLAAAFVMLVMPVQKASAAGTTEGSNLTWDSAYSGVITYRGEYYSYNFSLKQSGRVTLAFNVDSVSECAWTKIEEMNFLDESGSVVGSTRVSEGKTNVWIDLLAGNYTLEIVGHWGTGTGASFSFVPSFKSAGETKSEHSMAKNNELGMATPYKIGNKIKAQLACGDKVDIYKVKVSKNSYLNLTLFSKIKQMKITIENTAGDVTIGEYNITAGTHKYKYFLPKGTYYITFERTSGTGTYSFKTSSKVMPTVKIKKVKDTGKEITAAFKRNSDMQGYQIQVARDKKFKKGKKSFSYGNSKNVSAYGLKKGTYYVRIRAYKTRNVRVNHNYEIRYYYSGWSTVKKVYVK